MPFGVHVQANASMTHGLHELTVLRSVHREYRVGMAAACTVSVMVLGL